MKPEAVVYSSLRVPFCTVYLSVDYLGQFLPSAYLTWYPLEQNHMEDIMLEQNHMEDMMLNIFFEPWMGNWNKQMCLFVTKVSINNEIILNAIFYGFLRILKTIYITNTCIFKVWLLLAISILILLKHVNTNTPETNTNMSLISGP